MYKLTPEQKRNRLRLLEVSYIRKLSHLGSCLSALDLIDAIYKVKKKKDKFILSNGHAGLALYVILEKHGYLKDNEIFKLSIHPDRSEKNKIDVSTGSLGQGLPIAVGMALADKKSKVYCMISDGECSEGSIWESFRLVIELNLTNLTVIINYNGWSAYGAVKKRPLMAKLKASGFKISEVDGKNIKQIIGQLKIPAKQRPRLLFANTNVEQLPFLKKLGAHYHVMSSENYNLAKKYLNE